MRGSRSVRDNSVVTDSSDTHRWSHSPHSLSLFTHPRTETDSTLSLSLLPPVACPSHRLSPRCIASHPRSSSWPELYSRLNPVDACSPLWILRPPSQLLRSPSSPLRRPRPSRPHLSLPPRPPPCRRQGPHRADLLLAPASPDPPAAPGQPPATASQSPTPHPPPASPPARSARTSTASGQCPPAHDGDDRGLRTRRRQPPHLTASLVSHTNTHRGRVARAAQRHRETRLVVQLRERLHLPSHVPRRLGHCAPRPQRGAETHADKPRLARKTLFLPLPHSHAPTPLLESRTLGGDVFAARVLEVRNHRHRGVVVAVVNVPSATASAPGAPVRRLHTGDRALRRRPTTSRRRRTAVRVSRRPRAVAPTACLRRRRRRPGPRRALALLCAKRGVHTSRKTRSQGVHRLQPAPRPRGAGGAEEER